MATKKKKRPGRPRLSQGRGNSRFVGLRLSNGLLERLESWRRAQGDKPSLSDAIRRLVEAGLKK